MTTVKFDHSVKYKGVRHPAHEVFVVDNADIEELKREGVQVLNTSMPGMKPEPECEEIISEEVEQADDSVDDADIEQLREELLEYKLEQLIQFADDHGIELQGKTRKSDIYNLIVASFE